MQVRNEERVLVRKNGAGCRNTGQLGLKPVLTGFMA
jgi:hypothetical protein